jgi:hypothetical protein
MKTFTMGGHRFDMEIARIVVLTLSHTNIKSYRGDSEVWLRSNKNGYEYIGTHTDDILVVAQESEKIFDELRVQYKFKRTDTPKYHLVVDCIQGKNGKSRCWEMGFKTYVSEAIKKVEDLVKIELMIRVFGYLQK